MIRRPDTPLELIHGTLLTEAWQNASVAVVLFDEAARCWRRTTRTPISSATRENEIRDAAAGENILVDERGRLAYFDLLIRNKRLRGTAPIQRQDGSVLTVDYLIVETLIYRLPYFMALLWPSEIQNP